MFWKNANFFRLQSLSLVTKLMLLYSLSTLGILSAIGIFLYPTFLNVIQKLNGSELSSITAECYEKLIITLLISSLSAVFLGYLIARNGLNRMKEFEHKIDKISADSLDQRIDLNEWPKELKSFGIKFNTMLERIESSFIQLSQFSSDIAHELRTPVNNLMGMTEIVLTSDKVPDECQQLLEKNMNEYQHLSKLIENLLFLARTDHGQLTLKKETIHVKKEILAICDYYQILADEHQITISCVGDGVICADITLFKRAISNLLSNALKYSKPNHQIIFKIEPDGLWVNISIHDTGVGISDKHLTRLFDRFYRVDASRSSQSGGLGLGLAIVKSIIDLHQGNISIKSKPDVGTSVYLQLLSTP